MIKYFNILILRNILIILIAIFSFTIAFCQEYSWNQKTPMLHSALASSACAYNGKIYVFGGDQDGKAAGGGYGDNAVQIYDLEADTWTTGKSMPVKTFMHGSARIDNEIYVLGGGWFSGLKTNYIYDADKDEWKSGSSMPTGRGALGVCALDGKIYAIGGFNGSSVFDKNEMYDPGTDTWTEKAPLNTPRCGHAVVAAGGKIYAIGGTNNPAIAFKSVEVYDPGKDEWSDVKSMDSERFGIVAASVGNKIIAMGGTPMNMIRSPGIVEVYDIEQNEWQKIDQLPKASQWGAACSNGNSVYLIGGEDKCCMTFPVDEAGGASILDVLLELKTTIVLDMADELKKNEPEMTLFPNPVNSELNIEYYLNENGMTRISLYNVAGKMVSSLRYRYESTGYQQLRCAISDLKPGVYFIHLTNADLSVTKKLVIQK